VRNVASFTVLFFVLAAVQVIPHVGFWTMALHLFVLPGIGTSGWFHDKRVLGNGSKNNAINFTAYLLLFINKATP
jgi:hypothetical protein